MKNISVVLLILFCAIAFAESRAQQATSLSSTNFYNGSFDDALREARKQDKTLVLDFWADWCAPCLKMDKETFSDPELAKTLNENFVVYKVNIDTFDGMEIANRFAVESFPTIITLDNRGKFIYELKGFFPANYFREKLSPLSKQTEAYVSL